MNIEQVKEKIQELYDEWKKLQEYPVLYSSKMALIMDEIDILEDKKVELLKDINGMS